MCLNQSGLSIRPSVNLIYNIGFTKEATHTNMSDVRANLPLSSITFPLKEPQCIVVDREHDYKQYKKVWEKSLSKRIVNKVKRLLVS